MDSNQHFYTVWTHRSAQSIFGAASHPVVRNGELLCFATEDRAQAECDRLNAGAGDSHVHYTVKPAYVQPAPANSLARRKTVWRYSPKLSVGPLSAGWVNRLSALPSRD